MLKNQGAFGPANKKVFDYGDGSLAASTSLPTSTFRLSENLAFYRRVNANTNDYMAAMSAPVTADVATGGSLLAATTYKTSVAGSNRVGVGKPSATTDTLTASDASNTHVLRVTVPAQTGADRFDLFASTDTNPKWVARITEAQRAAGVTITAVGTVDPTSPGVNTVDIRVVGTGLANNAAPFNTAGTVDVDNLVKVPLNGNNRFLIKAIYTPDDWITSSATVSFNLIRYYSNGFISVGSNGSFVLQGNGVIHSNVPQQQHIGWSNQNSTISTVGEDYFAIGVFSFTPNTGYADLYYILQKSD